jgi:hypothetical protein
MLARRILKLGIALCALIAPAAHAAETGGASYAENAFTAVPAHAMLGGTLTFSGTAPAGRNVLIERLDREEGWVAEQLVTADDDGRYTAVWQPTHSGQFQMRAVMHGDNASAAGAPEELAVTVYRPAMATWYGPGFYGRRTACGQRMSRRLIGVAHKKLPCGTQVALYYKGETLIAPVVDRGPFRKGHSWDLTHAAAERLGFTYTDRIGAVRLP